MASSMTRRPSASAVVDASVAVKWVLPEAHSEPALRLLESGIGLAAPAHWLAEAVNAVKIACERSTIGRDEVQELVLTLAEAPVASVPIDRLALSAMDIGLRIGASIHDALYLALAVRDDAQLITDDRRLIQAARRDAQLRGRVHWIGDA